MSNHQIHNLHAAACAYASAKEKREHEQKSPRNIQQSQIERER